jgi:hypothetical protein
MAAGASTGWHTHPGPSLIGHVDPAGGAARNELHRTARASTSRSLRTMCTTPPPTSMNEELGWFALCTSPLQDGSSAS